MKPFRFILDVHLGKLSKYLRLCGFDTYIEQNMTDGEIIDISIKDQRIILTRDKLLLENKRVNHGYRVCSSKPDEQLKEVFERFGLKSKLRPFTRCIECNGILSDVSKEEIIERLLPKTKDIYTYFKKCNGCEKIYWEGSHYEKMKHFIESITSHQSPITNH